MKMATTMMKWRKSCCDRVFPSMLRAKIIHSAHSAGSSHVEKYSVRRNPPLIQGTRSCLSVLLHVMSLKMIANEFNIT